MDRSKSRTKSDNMNFLYIKDKLHNNSRESLISVVLASGDGYVAQCKLCNGGNKLKNIYVDHSDLILKRIFDVEVPPDALICDSCYKCLKITERFHSVVLSSLGKYRQGTDEINTSKNIEIVTSNYVDKVNETGNPHKEVQIKKIKTEPFVRRENKLSCVNLKRNNMIRRANIVCTVCGQRYPMVVPLEGADNFVCCRCKKYKYKQDCKKKGSSVITVEKQNCEKFEQFRKTKPASSVIRPRSPQRKDKETQPSQFKKYKQPVHRATDVCFDEITYTPRVWK